MRIKCLCLIVIALVIALVSPAFCNNEPGQFANNWLWNVQSGVSDGSGDYGMPQMAIEASAQGTDNNGASEEPAIIYSDVPATYALTYHKNEVGEWVGQTGFYQADWAGPFAPGQTKTWGVYVWASTSLPLSCGSMDINLVNMVPVWNPDAFHFQLTLESKPDSVTGGPDMGTVWNLDIPVVNIQFPIYRTDNGLTGYKFEFSATAVPEPSSILALFAGIGGFGGIIFRRRAH